MVNVDDKPSSEDRMHTRTVCEQVLGVKVLSARCPDKT